MKTKAALEEEIVELKLRVAGLEAACAAYQFALAHMSKPEPTYPAYDPWLPAGQKWYPDTTFPSPPWKITN